MIHAHTGARPPAALRIITTISTICINKKQVRNSILLLCMTIMSLSGARPPAALRRLRARHDFCNNGSNVQQY